MSIDEQPMNVYWSGKRTETSNNFKTNYKGSVATKNNLPSLGNKTGDMYNVTDSGENLIWNGDSWDSLSGDILKTLNWQKSEKDNTVAIYPVPETTLYPVVEFAFTETDPAEGEKSSTNPSIITGVSSITVTRCETVGVDSTDYTVNLGNTFYGGSIDLSTGLMTVTQFFYSFAGGEITGSSDKGDGWLMFIYRPSDIIPLDSTVSSDKACTHFPFVFSNNQQSLHWYVQSAGSICIFSNQFADTDKFNAWLATQALAGTPVQVTYKIATPYTVQLSPIQILSLSQPNKYTPRINTVYSDQQTVQVGYAKSPIRSEYELAQAIAAIE